MPRKPRGPAQADTVRMLGAGHAIRVSTGAQIPAMAPERTVAGSERPVGADLVSKSTSTGSDPLSCVLDAMSEGELQQDIEDGLRQRGYLVWHVRDARLMAAGLPDIIAVHPTRVPRRVLFWELKRADKHPTKRQREALAALSDVYGVDARVVRPADWLALSEEV